jgi:queuine/archaeosine tRNA-ribosyltransferase
LLIKKKSFRSYIVDALGKTFQTPLFIPAISSIKANWTILEYLGLLENLGYPAFLASAYDYCRLNKNDRQNFEGIKSEYSKKQTIFFLDNGNYEAYWYKDQKWTLDGLKTALDTMCPDFCFSFDVFWEKDMKVEKHIKDTVTSIAKTAGLQKTGSTIALLHANPELFPGMIQKVVDYINPEIVAVPERELGFGVFERAQTIKNIRTQLDKTDKPILLHVLGTGNPRSILIYTLCGADMYDALDWSSYFVDPKSGHLYHFSQKDLLNCGCKACRMQKVPYDYQVMAHNLIFYETYLDRIRSSLESGRVDSMLKEYFSGECISEIKKIGGFE